MFHFVEIPTQDNLVYTKVTKVQRGVKKLGRCFVIREFRNSKKLTRVYIVNVKRYESMIFIELEAENRFVCDCGRPISKVKFDKGEMNQLS